MIYNKLCACMGPMYGEPSCYCTMIALGKQSEMDNNPIRIAANKKTEEDLIGLEKFFEMNREANANNT